MLERFISNRICIPCNLDLMTWCNTGKRVYEYMTLLFHGTVGYFILIFGCMLRNQCVKQESTDT